MTTTDPGTLPARTRQQRQLQALTDALQASEEQRCRQLRIVADIAHDLRSPLGRIVGYARLMQQGADDAGDLRQHAAVVEREAVHQLALIDEMLEHARGELDELEMQPRATDLMALLDAVALHAHRLAARRHNDFVLACGPDAACRVLVDGARLQQVLLALLGNACACCRSGVITLAVTSLAEDSSVRLRFEVTEGGVDGARNDRSNARATFEHAQPTNDDLGLGLLIARRIVQRLGGTLQLHADDEQSRRMAFELRLPEMPALQPIPATAGPTPTPSTPCTPILLAAAVPPPADASRPSQASLDQLRLLAAAGQWRGLEEWLVQAAAAQPHCRAFLARVRTALGNLQFDAILEMASVRT
ncbi:MAG: HAMP domain-containing sensor histidine kinase [Variovorax sp.]